VDASAQAADVVVVGSAVSAHDAGARVQMVERTSSIGGTTAVSGGGVWMPQNRHMAERGVDDSRDEALAYMGRLTAGRTPVEMLERYVDRGPGIVADIEDRTPLRLAAMSWPDYHPEMDGAKSSGRMLEPALYDTGRLGRWAAALRRPPVLGLPITLQEATVEWRPTYAPERFDADEVQRRVADHQVACGQARCSRGVCHGVSSRCSRPGPARSPWTGTGSPDWSSNEVVGDRRSRLLPSCSHQADTNGTRG
jgi:hypothetical protein